MLKLEPPDCPERLLLTDRTLLLLLERPLADSALSNDSLRSIGIPLGEVEADDGFSVFPATGEFRLGGDDFSSGVLG